MQNNEPVKNQKPAAAVTPNKILYEVSQQILKDQDKIIATWEDRVRKKIVAADQQTSLSLQNSLHFFLEELSKALEQTSQSPNYDLDEFGMARKHGFLRAEFSGYKLPQLLKEFSLLRRILFENLYQVNLFSFEVALVINNAIDSSISFAATEFADIKQAAVQGALEDAEASNEELDQFASVAAHDLKSPLATITGYLELLKDEIQKLDGTDTLEYVEIIEKSSVRMRALIDSLLDYAKLARSNKGFDTVDLNTVMGATLQNLHDTIIHTKAVVRYDKLPAVKGDPELLGQVFQNLIANSIKFHSDDPPLIEISYKPHNGMLLFAVKDNGIGFDPKEKDNVFGLYKKLRTETKYQGAGIGLATCKKVVELHGGKIWAYSSPGKGSTFYFTLPYAETLHS
jgi:signal transduction histidine kinase